MRRLWILRAATVGLMMQCGLPTTGDAAPGLPLLAERPVPAAMDPTPLWSAASSEVPTKVQQLCAGGAAGPRPPSSQTRRSFFEFSDEELVPAAYGPRASERPLLGLPRAGWELKEAIEQRERSLKQCYRWARQQVPTLQGLLRVDAELEPLGAIPRLNVSTEDVRAERLAGCVQGVLSSLRLERATPRRTRAHLLLRFLPSGIGPSRQVVARPERPIDAPLPYACVPIPAVIPEDELDLRTPLLTIDDYDRMQAAAEPRPREPVAREASQQNVVRSIPALPPTPILRAKTRHQLGSKDAVLEALRSNRGAYRACYVDALSRTPAAFGRVLIKFTIDRAGSITASIKASNSGDGKLDECLRAAVEEVWLHPWLPASADSVTEGLYPFVLKPLLSTLIKVPRQDTPTNIEQRAAQQLKAGDGAGALRSYAALLHAVAAEHSPRECGLRISLLEAARLRFVWQADEPRLDALADSLLTRLEQPAAGAECTERAVALLLELSTAQHRAEHPLLSKARLDKLTARYQRLLKLPLQSEPATQLRYLLAEAQDLRGNYCAAAPSYDTVVAETRDERTKRSAAGQAVQAWQQCLYPAWDESFERLRFLTEDSAVVIDPRLWSAFRKLEALYGR